MENIKKKNWFMNFIEALTSPTSINNGMIDERTLSEEDKELLKEMRKKSKVGNIQGNYNIDSKKAMQDAEKKAQDMEKDSDERTM